ncbi:MAG: PadR family transcriptional regulator [Gemmatimonadales bacterium]
MRRLLTDFELMAMLAVLRRGTEAYGVAVAEELRSTAGRSVVLAAVYAALGRLEEKGLIASRMGEPTAERGGRAKKYFRLTADGLCAVQDTRRALEAMWTDLPALEPGVP